MPEASQKGRMVEKIALEEHFLCPGFEEYWNTTTGDLPQPKREQALARRARAWRWGALACAGALAVLVPLRVGMAGTTPTTTQRLQALEDKLSHVSVQTVNGSGCPAGSASVAMQPDNTGFRIRYSDFRAEDGGTAEPTAIRKNCQVNLLVHVPQGFTFAIARGESVRKTESRWLNGES